jgi:D-alanyl-D-alanine carboxypeptidase
MRVSGLDAGFPVSLWEGQIMRAWIAAVFVAAAITAHGAAAGPALVFDAADGKVLYAEDQDNQWRPASLTKLMTAYLVFEAIKDGKLTPETRIGYSEQAYSQEPTKVGLPVGAQLSVETALQALIIMSANDVAVMLAEAVAGSHEAFVARMNATAVRLGMTRSRFANANGLPAPDQVTTARDLARLAAAVVRDFPDHAQLWSLPGMSIGKRRLPTHNVLLSKYAGADGMKTGFICDSGYNVVASATRDGRKLIAVVLGETTVAGRFQRAADLLEHGFRKYAWTELFPAQSLATLPMAEDAAGPTTIRQLVCGARLEVAKGGEKGKVAAQARAPSNRWPPW